MTPRENIHGTGLMLDGHGLLLRGRSGAGKSLLALTLLDSYDSRGLPAFLVADDRVDLEASRPGLVMHAPKTIAGMIELRGRGIVARPHVASAPLHLVIDLVDRFERLVEEDELTTVIDGVTLARAPVPEARLVPLEHQRLLVLEALRALPLKGRRRGKKALES